MERLKERAYVGMAERGITGDVADELFTKMKAFTNYGFPQSHWVSFAYLVYASSWIKYHEPAAFCAALLNAQPMGFWSPHTLVRDARRHGVVVRTPDLNASLAAATLEPCGPSEGGVAVRLGIGSVRGIGAELADEIEAVRKAGGLFADTEDLVRRVPSLTLAQLEAMATAGVFGECFGLDRREALWTVGATAQSRPGRLPGVVTGDAAPRLPGMTPVEEAVADLWATGVSPDGHPTIFVREELTKLGVLTSSQLWDPEPGSMVHVAGVVTHRQRPMTAQGVTFLNLEDETGLINVVVSKGCWARFRKVAREAPAMLIRGRLERAEGVVNIVAEHLAPLPMPVKAVPRFPRVTPGVRPPLSHLPESGPVVRTPGSSRREQAGECSPSTLAVAVEEPRVRGDHRCEHAGIDLDPVLVAARRVVDRRDRQVVSPRSDDPAVFVRGEHAGVVVDRGDGQVVVGERDHAEQEGPSLESVTDGATGAGAAPPRGYRSMPRATWTNAWGVLTARQTRSAGASSRVLTVMVRMAELCEYCSCSTIRIPRPVSSPANVLFRSGRGRSTHGSSTRQLAFSTTSATTPRRRTPSPTPPRSRSDRCTSTSRTRMRCSSPWPNGTSTRCDRSSP